MPVRCPNCNCGHSRVTHTYSSEYQLRGKGKNIIRRRRVCRYCGTSYSTLEKPEEEILKEKHGHITQQNPYLPGL